jgi:hypothetical protein
MSEYIIKKLEPLLDIIVDPIIAALKKLPLIVLIIAISIISAISVAAYHYRDILISISYDVIYIPRVLTDSSSIPFSSDISTHMVSTQHRLLLTIDTDLDEISSGTTSNILVPWSAAQAVVAVHDFDKSKLDVQHIVKFINYGKAPMSECWAETPDRLREFCNPFIAGWILYAFAEMGIPSSKATLETLLSEQQVGGWWSTFPANNDRQYASTYTTAWVLLGVSKQKQKGYVSADQISAVDKALIRGTQWLLSARNHARWKNYPYLTADEASQSESISGVVLHAINNVIDVEALQLDKEQLNKEWLEKLPDRIVTAGETEKVYIGIPTKAGWAFDHFEQLQMPWLTVATVDAFPSGNVFQRAKALKWLENVLDDESVSSSDSRNNWWRAELLYSLNYAIKHSVRNGG